MTRGAMTFWYVFALFIVAATACGGYAATYWSLRHMASHQTAIQKLTQQQGWTATVLMHAREYLNSTSPAEKTAASEALLNALDNLSRGNDDLTQRGSALGLPSVEGGQLAQVYLHPSNGLSALVTKYVDDVRALIALEAAQDIDDTHPRARYLLKEAPQRILEQIERVTQTHRAESDSRVAQSLQLRGGFVIAIIVVLVLEGIFIFRPMTRLIDEERIALRTLNDELERVATRDHLTQVFNRTKFEEIEGLEGARAIRSKKPVGIILMDVDRFKQFNDDHGHAMGDRVLQRVAEVLQAKTRGVDYVLRWGGEEFLVVTPGNDLDGTAQTAEKLRACVAEAPISQGLSVTISLGVTITDGHEPMERAVERADQALYQAKDAGRNRVVTQPYAAGAQTA